jgi:fatty-acyl-CoA synthase
VSGDRVGQVQVRGPAVMHAYYRRTPAESGVSADGWLQTGDLGFYADGSLYICGRLKEMIKVNGKNHYPQDVEELLTATEGIYENRCVAFGIERGQAEALSVVAESRLTGLAARSLRDRIHSLVATRTGLPDVEVYVTRPNTIALTTSGKPQRLRMRQSVMNGSLMESLVDLGGEAPRSAVN